MAADGVDPRMVARLRRVSWIAAAVVMAIGTIVIAGWILGLERVRRVDTILESMRLNAAIPIVLLGGAVILDLEGYRRAGRAAAATAGLLATLTVVKHVTGVDVGIDQLLVGNATLSDGPPRRPSIATTLFVLGSAVAILSLDVRVRRRPIAPSIAMLVLIGGVMATAGYAYGVSGGEALAPLVPLQLHVGVTVLALAVAILFARPTSGAVSIFASDTLGGTLARRLLPLFGTLILVFGWLRIVGERAGVFGTINGVTLHAAVTLTGIVFLVWASATRLARADLERRRALDELREVIEHAPDGLVVVLDEKIVYGNHVLEEILGRRDGDLIGTPLLALVQPADRAALRAALDGDARGRWERARVTRGDGTTRLLELARLEDVHFGGTPCALVAVRDVTEQVALDQHLATADRLATVGLLVASVGHEISNPLTSLLLQLDILAKGNRPDAAAATADAYLCAQRIRDIVRDLRVLARPDTGQVAPIPLAPVIEATLRIATPELRTRATVERALHAAPAVIANESRVGQVLLNLVVNAAQAIPEGEPARNHVRVTLDTDDDGWAVIEVSDTGCGIPPEVQGRLFQPFFTTKPSGTGLGLSISHRIVTSLGGTISVASEPGAGTTFRIRLPPSGAAVDREPSPGSGSRAGASVRNARRGRPT